jgi:subtilase family serine protease
LFEKTSNLPWCKGVISLRSALVYLVVAATASTWAAGGTKKLSGHVPDAAKRLTAKGSLPLTNRLDLAIGLPLRDAAGLDAFLGQVYDPRSTNFRKYLTPDQFTARFGPTEADYAALVAFARQNQLTVTATHSNRLLLDVNGSVDAIQRAFHVNMNAYRHPTENRDFYAPDTEPTVDASLPVADISGLNNYTLPHPNSLRMDAATGSNAVPKSGSGSGGNYLGNDFRAAYLPGVTLTGSGQIVGLVEFDGFYASDISAYESAAGLAAVPLQTVLLDGFNGTPTTGANSGDAEVSLDIEMAVAMAPGLAKIVSFEAGPSGLQNDVLNAMAASNQIKQFSCSWGWSGGPSTTTDNIFKQMAAQGQSFFCAVGDSDAFTVGSTSANGVDNTSLANAPTSSPYITAVGGTTLSTTGPGGAWSSETVWNWGLKSGSYVGTCGGVSSYYAIPSWQTGISMAGNGGSTANRNVPDVALTADNIYVYYGAGSAGSFGGTSCAAPLWAAVAALMNQQTAQTGRPAVGFLNPAIYAIGKGSGYADCFHDTTTGNNTSSSSPNNYYAVAGYDLCTGWGTPAGQSLIAALAGTPDSLRISPGTGFTAVGSVDGPFTPNSQTLILSNVSASPITWSLVNGTGWLDAEPVGGTLSADATTNVTVTLNAGAGTLAAGIYITNITFSNLTTQIGQSETFTLQIGQSIVQNGGFETGDFTGWTLVGNTVVGRGRRATIYDAVESAATGYQVVHSGSYGAFLGDNQVATLSQTFSTMPGQNYLLSFWLDNPGSGSIQQFSVRWNGTSLSSLINPPAFSWTNYQFIVTATNASSVLQFAVENDPDYFGLDDVSLAPIPAATFGPAVKTADNFSLTWNTASGLTYQVQYTTDLIQPNWVNLGAPVMATGNSLTITDSGADSSTTQRFYRLTQAP